jgi:hypothetical protein
VGKRQEGVAPSAPDLRHGVQQRAREADCAACCRTVTAGAVLGKYDLAAVKIFAEIDRNCEAAMRRPFCGVVAM